MSQGLLCKVVVQPCNGLRFVCGGLVCVGEASPLSVWLCRGTVWFACYESSQVLWRTSTACGLCGLSWEQSPLVSVRVWRGIDDI